MVMFVGRLEQQQACLFELVYESQSNSLLGYQLTEMYPLILQQPRLFFIMFNLALPSMDLWNKPSLPVASAYRMLAGLRSR